MNPESLIKVASTTFKLGEIISNPEFIPGGDININYKLKTINGEFLIKIINIENYKKNYFLDQERLIFSLTFSEYLAEIMSKYNIPTVPALTFANNHKLLIDSDHIVLVYPFVNAKVFPNEYLTNEHIQKIAELISKIHSLKIEGFDKETALLKWNMTLDFFLKLAQQKPWLSLKNIESMPTIKSLFDVLHDFIERKCSITHEELNNIDDLVLTHNDLKPKNVLWNTRNEPIIIDWESGGYMSLAADYLDTLLAWCLVFKEEKYELDVKKVKIFMQEYQKKQPIPTITDTTISIVVAKWLIWLTFCINRLSQQENRNMYINFIYENLNILKFIQENETELKNLN